MNLLSIHNFMKKSPKERFLLVIGLLILFAYILMALALFFWKKLPVNIPQMSRNLMGLLILVYAYIRFVRLLKNSNEND